MQAFPFLDPEQIPIIYNEPDLTRFHPGGEGAKVRARTAFHLPAQADLILTAGTNFRLKGVHVLLEALAELPASFHLAVAGGREELLNQARQCGVQDRVHFLGRVDDMPKLYHAADIFVLNTFYDACSNAVLEAWPAACRYCHDSERKLRFATQPYCPIRPTFRSWSAASGTDPWRFHGPAGFSPPRGLAPYAEIIRGLARAKMNPPATNTTTLLQNRKMP